MLEDKKQIFYECRGFGKTSHPKAIFTSNQCPMCLKKFHIPISKPPQESILFDQINKNKIFNFLGISPNKDNKIYFLLIILTLVSAFTTIYGAMQIFPKGIAIPVGLTVQILLFLLISSKKNLKHYLGIKYILIGIFSFISIYTSFFAYYELLTNDINKQDAYYRAIVAHQKMISDVFAPIEEQVNRLQSDLANQEELIKNEKNGQRGNGVGCKSICTKLIKEKEILEKELKYNKKIYDKIKPLFLFNTKNKTPENIYTLDREALGSISKNCLYNKNFTCLPDYYLNISDPELENTYIDRAKSIKLLAPFNKIYQAENAAIGAAVIAILVDGAIILLGFGVDLKIKYKTLTLNINGDINSFFETLINLINFNQGYLINIYDFTENKKAYLTLLNEIQIYTTWINTTNEEGYTLNDKKSILKWLTLEREKQSDVDKSPHRIILAIPILTSQQD